MLVNEDIFPKTIMIVSFCICIVSKNIDNCSLWKSFTFLLIDKINKNKIKNIIRNFFAK